ncbi:MAG: hypothetical protein K5648_00975 [Erysipelotrichaceae bacterium]|nr:hypothetical protein [Erysipelotrichaceae bacterium]
MEEKKRFELPDEIAEAVSGGKLKDDWQMIVKMSVLAYKNFYSRNEEGRAKIEDVLADTDKILNSIRTDSKDLSDVEQDKKILQDYIREIWNA